MSSEQPPPQEQTYPGSTGSMDPEPNDEMTGYVGRDLLAGRKALITGGDSGIGRAVAVAFAEEGADVAMAYLSEGDDASHTKKLVEAGAVAACACPATSPTATTAVAPSSAPPTSSAGSTSSSTTPPPRSRSGRSRSSPTSSGPARST